MCSTSSKACLDVLSTGASAKAERSGEGGLSVPPTFFEVSTAVAFEIFKRAAVDVADRRSGPGRPLRCDQRADADDHGHHHDRLRPRASSWQHSRTDRVRESRHCQARRAAGDRAITERGSLANFRSRPRGGSADLRCACDDYRSPLSAAQPGAGGPASTRKRGRRGVDPRAMVDARQPCLDRGDCHWTDRLRMAGAARMAASALRLASVARDASSRRTGRRTANC